MKELKEDFSEPNKPLDLPMTAKTAKICLSTKLCLRGGKFKISLRF